MRTQALLLAGGAVAATAGIAVAVATSGGTAASAPPRATTVRIIDNAFLRGVQRPVVHVRAGSAVRWRWTSHQSHSVLVRSGPVRFASPVRNSGSFTHRFTRPGTYRIVCSLHAPGMKMAVVVS